MSICLNANVSVTHSVLSDIRVIILPDRLDIKTTSVGIAPTPIVKGVIDIAIPLITNISKFIKVNVSPLCKVDTLDPNRELFLVKEGVFLLVDGDEFKVLKEYELQE